jgi:O-antigen/teichoic acid export membrane protein
MRWLRVGGPIALAGIACDAFDQIDLQMVELIDDNEDRVGQFAAAIKISDLVFVVHAAACLVLVPRLSRLLEAGDRAAIQRFAGRIFGIVLFGAAVIAVVVSVFHHQLAHLFGDGFDGALAPVLILAAGNVLIAALALAWVFLSLSDHERDPLAPIGIGLFVLAIALYLVIPHWHLAGAAACKVAVSIAVYGWMTWRVRRLTGIALWKLW